MKLLAKAQAGMNNFELLGAWYGLGDGLGFNVQSRYATFKSRKSAIRFKQLAPAWVVGCRLA